MPAVTADTLTLPRLPEATPTETERPVKRVTTAPSGFEGEGFPVRRAFAGVPTDELDPFVHMDQMGSVDYGPGESRGTNWHPHRGFETVTYMLDGTFQHQDSHGGGGVITDGATQWMTAGGGILHIETPPEAQLSLPWRPTAPPWCTCSPVSAASVPRAAPSRAASWRCSGPATASLCVLGTARSRWRRLSSGASRSASRSPGTGRS